jgi:hypothetical protein
MANSLLPETAAITPEGIRASWLQKGFLLRSLITLLTARVHLCGRLKERFENATDLSDQKFLDFLYQSWLLAENLCSVYELLHDPDAKDIRSKEVRQKTPGDAAGRQLKGLTSFFKKATGENAWIQHLGNDEYLRTHGFDVEDGRRLVKDLLKRNRKALADDYEFIRHFLDEYRDICNAYKHGRALFTLSHSTTTDASNKVVSLHMERRHDRLLAIRMSNSGGDGSTSVIEFLLDDAAIQAVFRNSEKVCSQILRVSSQIVAIVDALETHLEVLEGRSEPRDHPIPFLLFIEVPTADDIKLLVNADGGHEASRDATAERQS